MTWGSVITLCSLSFFLYVALHHCYEDLSRMISAIVSGSFIWVLSVGSWYGEAVISHYMFPDDTLIFCEETDDLCSLWCYLCA